MQASRLPKSTYLYNPRGKRDVGRPGGRWEDEFLRLLNVGMGFDHEILQLEEEETVIVDTKEDNKLVMKFIPRKLN
jgi:hypothetical protein